MQRMEFCDFTIIRKIISRMKKHYSPVVLIVGNPNSGKTMLSAKMAETIPYTYLFVFPILDNPVPLKV